jgi:hypothetical protein
MWCKVEYQKLALLALPAFLRKPITVGYLQAFIVPIANMYDKWRWYRDENLYRVHHTGQVCYLRKVLNDKLDPSLRRIYLGDGQRYKRPYLYTTGENKPVFLKTMYLREASDYADTGVDFNVWVPQSIIDSSIYELKWLLDYYKLGGKKYKINAL